MARTDPRDVQEAAAALRRVLAEVTAGRLAEGSARGAAVRRRLEGAVLALEAVARRR